MVDREVLVLAEGPGHQVASGSPALLDLASAPSLQSGVPVRRTRRTRLHQRGVHHRPVAQDHPLLVGLIVHGPEDAAHQAPLHDRVPETADRRVVRRAVRLAEADETGATKDRCAGAPPAPGRSGRADAGAASPSSSEAADTPSGPSRSVQNVHHRADAAQSTAAWILSRRSLGPRFSPTASSANVLEPVSQCMPSPRKTRIIHDEHIESRIALFAKAPKGERRSGFMTKW